MEQLKETVERTMESHIGLVTISGVLFDLANWSLGVPGEVGEMIEHFKKYIFHNKPLDEVEAQKEMGDVYWYLQAICSTLNWNPEEIMRMNSDKLRERYPERFKKES